MSRERGHATVVTDASRRIGRKARRPRAFRGIEARLASRDPRKGEAAAQGLGLLHDVERREG